LDSTFIKQCYDTLLIDAHSKTGRLNSRVNFVLDEFANSVTRSALKRCGA